MYIIFFNLFPMQKAASATYNCPPRLKHTKCSPNILSSNLLYPFDLDPLLGMKKLLMNVANLNIYRHQDNMLLRMLYY